MDGGVKRLYGHLAPANSPAMGVVGIDGEFRSLPGGTILSDEVGRLTGMFKDKATALRGFLYGEDEPFRFLTSNHLFYFSVSLD